MRREATLSVEVAKAGGAEEIEHLPRRLLLPGGPLHGAARGRRREATLRGTLDLIPRGV